MYATDRTSTDTGWQKRNQIKLYKLYAAKLQFTFRLYITTRTTPLIGYVEGKWFIRQCVGENKFQNMLKYMCRTANIASDNMLTHKFKKISLANISV